MRTYLTIHNLRRATVLGCAVAVMSIPRILEGGIYFGFRIFSLFPLLIIIAGAVTAWGNCGGMVGPFPGRNPSYRGLGIAIVAALILVPVLFAFDSGVLRQLAENKGPDSLLVRLAFPTDVRGCLAIVLWSAGFDTLFFKGATMSFLARLTKRQSVAVVGSVLFSVAITSSKFTHMGMALSGLGIVTAAVTSIAGCLIYARGGLIPAMAFGSLLSARHLVRLLAT